MTNNYCEYFDVDENYFPQINPSSLERDPKIWHRTYPHQTFITMLKNVEFILARQEYRSLWIEGAYGTGKSLCAYTLKKILDVPEEELRLYWDKYAPLKTKPDLLEKIIGQKNSGILTVYRYSSGGIQSPRQLFVAMQDSIRAALIEKGLYAGENTLKESVISWIEKSYNQKYFNDLLSQPEWNSLFSQNNAEEIINDLRKGGELKTLMDNIFQMAETEGITALNIDVDGFINWLNDVIDNNNIKIVFIWDEFSDYFRNNLQSLSDFQKIVELVSSKPFFFIPVTHESGQHFANNETGIKVINRFIKVEIKLPDNIAFELIGHSFKPKPAAEDNWNRLAGHLNARLGSSRTAVMTEAKISNPDIIKDIMPIHPMAAFALKNISAAFKSNQRSMFDFIKSTNEDVKAFQWFIENTGPKDLHPLLTVDLLWDFFYENGKDNLTQDIRRILDFYPKYEHNLREDEQAVLKAILIMQAIDHRLGSQIDLLKATDQNLSYIFEGVTSGLDVRCKGIAKQLLEKKILTTRPIRNGINAYFALAEDTGNTGDIEKKIRENSPTSKLVIEGGLNNLLNFPPSLKLRFESNKTPIVILTHDNFKSEIYKLKNINMGWNFQTAIAFARDEKEALSLREKIQKTVLDENFKDIIFIDALSNPLGEEDFNLYVKYSALAIEHVKNVNLSKDYANKAKNILSIDWSGRISNGKFILYSYNNIDGEIINNSNSLSTHLQKIVALRFPATLEFDFAKGLTENHFKISNLKSSALSGIKQETSGSLRGLEKNILSKVWNLDNYWKIPLTSDLLISNIKNKIEKAITNKFEIDGQISIDVIYDLLEFEYGFAPSNLSAFVLGFLLKEYSSDPFRYADSRGKHEPMTHEKMAEMISNYMGNKSFKTYIVKMTPEEMAFYRLSEEAWGLSSNSYSSARQVASAIELKMKSFGLPTWCLEDVDHNGVFSIIQKFIELIKAEGEEAHTKAVLIGKAVIEDPNITKELQNLITAENHIIGILRFLETYEDGKLLKLAKDINAEENIVIDVKRLFEVKYSSIWDKETGINLINNLFSEYLFVRETNNLLVVNAHSKAEAFSQWRDYLKFVGISYELFYEKYPSLKTFFSILLDIYKEFEILPDQIKIMNESLQNHSDEIQNALRNDQVFSEVYGLYLGNLSESQISDVRIKLPTGMFQLHKTDCNIKIKKAVDEFSKGLLKTQLYEIWYAKTQTKNPRDWSRRNRIPILCCVPVKDYSDLKAVFETLNRNEAPDADIKFALDYIQKSNIFQLLDDRQHCEDSFKNNILGNYKFLLTNLNQVKDELEDLPIEIYDWYGNPIVKSYIEKLAKAEYFAGGSNKVDEIINEMDDAQLKKYLKSLIKDNISVGIEIIKSKGE